MPTAGGVRLKFVMVRSELQASVPNHATTALAPTPDPLYIRDLCMDDTRLKKIRLRAWRRGFREADLLLGPFADYYCPRFSAEQLDLLEALMNEADQDIYDWFLGRAETPPEFDNEIMVLLKGFDPSVGAPRHGG
jgi:antitoxin CptB